MKVKSLYPIIVVENLEETKKFYCETLGFSVKHDMTRKDGGHVIVLSNECNLELELMEKPKAGPIKMETGLYGFRMNVDNMDNVCAELKENGITVSPVIETATAKNMMIKDNNGTNITLMEHIKK